MADDETGEVLDWKDARRAAIVAEARSELGPYHKGSPQVTGYWREVALPGWNAGQIAYASKHAEWCGVFALACLRRALGLPELVWHVLDGQVGFVVPLKLELTSTPQPGDIAIRPVPFWHHAIVATFDGVDLVTVDGNQAGGVVERRRPAPRKGMQYYSIDPLLDRALEAEIARG